MATERLERLGPIEEAVEERLATLRETDFVSRLWRKDPSLWKKDEAHRGEIENRLGWLDAVRVMEPRVDSLRGFAEEVRREFGRVLLLGMGGSSLCPELLAKTFGAAEGFPALRILDSTDPAAVREATAWAAEKPTLFLVASKSGTTAEVDAFRRHFTERTADPRRFVAITDPGSPLESLAGQEGYRRVFLNPPDIGGRYSALSLFGLGPAALLGIDLDSFLGAAAAMARACGPEGAPAENPGVRLGAILAASALAGRDKATLLFPPSLAPLGAWIEQLVAESSGKEGKGIVPVGGEPVGEPEEYGADRLFLYTSGGGPDEGNGPLGVLERAGHPVVRIETPGAGALGAEFFRWEVATATACSLLGVNAFDEPNVRESKEETKRLLARYAEQGDLGEDAPRTEEGGVALFSDRRLEGPAGDVEGWIRAHRGRTGAGDYVAFLAYVRPAEETLRLLGDLRAAARRATSLATIAAIGPRFLHSTGQLFKGGTNEGLFFQITCEDREDLPIPGLAHSFGTLKRAQALGDFAALEARGRRAIRWHIDGDVVRGMKRLLAALGG